MARYIGPKSKIARRFGEPIFGADKVLSKRNFPPGQHGNNRRRKMSEYGVMLAEKQKAKYTYGVLERQFRNMFDKAAKADGITGEVLLQNLECRLDNVVFRLGIAPTRAAARQLVGHKHIVVDGKVVNIPSFAVKPGMVVGVREKSKSLEVIVALPPTALIASSAVFEKALASTSNFALSSPLPRTFTSSLPFVRPAALSSSIPILVRFFASARA